MSILYVDGPFKHVVWGGAHTLLMPKSPIFRHLHNVRQEQKVHSRTQLHEALESV
jgi:hypothetical protein